MMHKRGRNGIPAWAFFVLACLAALVLPAASAGAEDLEIGTSVNVIVTDSFQIFSQTEDFTLGVGEDAQLQVTASKDVQTWTWDVSTDGGTIWNGAPGAANQGTYDVDDARLNRNTNGADVPYRYRVTATTAAGEIASAVIQVLVSDAYAYRKIDLRDGDADVAAYMHDETRLVITPLPDDVPVAETLAAELDPGYVPLLICDVSLVNQNGSVVPYFGALLVRFHVGTQYNGQTLNVYHLHDNTINTYSGVVTGGILPIVVQELSPFLIEVPDATAHTIAAGAEAHGSIAPAGNVTVPDGGAKTFIFQPNVGYAIDQVLVDGTPVTVSGNSYTFTNVTADRTIQVRYRAVAQNPAVTHTVTVRSGSNGTVTPNGAQSVVHGEPLTLTIAPNTGYELDTLLINGTSVRVTGRTHTIAAVESDLTVAATFRTVNTQPPPTVYRTITAEAGEHGSISPAGSVTVEYGGGMYFHFQPESGYAVDGVFIDGRAESVAHASYQFIGVTDNRTIRVTFRLSSDPPTTYHAITPSWGENGRISPGETVNVAAGGSQTFYMIPNSGFAVEGVWIDGVRQSGAISQYTFTNVTAEHTIRASFRRMATPPTGDEENKLLWAGLIVVLTLLLGLCLFYMQKLKRIDAPHDPE